MCVDSCNCQGTCTECKHDKEKKVKKESSKFFKDLMEESQQNPGFYEEGFKLEFAIYLDEMLRKFKYTQASFARELKVNRSWIHRILCAEENLSISTMMKLLAPFRIYLFPQFKKYPKIQKSSK
jgi:hypothetical protein